MKKTEPTERTYNGWRKRYKCHKNKGDHTYVLVYATWWRLGVSFNTIFADYKCTACGKQHVKVVKHTSPH